MKDFIKPTFVLVIVGIVSAGLLSFVYNKTLPEIEKRAKESLNESLSLVFPVEGVEFENVIPDTLWVAKKDGNVLGIVFVNISKGYSGIIKVVVGLDREGKILKVFVPKDVLTETPGLGMKVAEESFLKQFSGLKKEEVYLKKDGGKIDGITAATISSRATTNAVRNGIEKYFSKIEELSMKWYEKRIKELFPEDSIEMLKENVWRIKDRIVYYSEEEGYGGKIGVIVVLKDKKIEKIYIQSPEEGFDETEGFGSKVREEEFISKFIGKRPEDVKKIDGITGATISSNAVKNAIINGYKMIGGEK
uniref:Ion-translocating oxidoreductase complex subunit G n=1 Tax=candidate division WOR-3 bacterium TaxID=2052148 RepID=A0A7C4Y5Q7_UNCW3